jgi:hypothetical protein
MGFKLFKDWKRVDGGGFHAILGAIPFVLLWWFAGAHPILLGVVHTLFWCMWEVWQGVRDDKGANPFSPKWGDQKRSEMWFPMLTGVVLTVVLMVIDTAM